MKLGQKTVALMPSHPSQLWMLLAVARVLESEMRVVWILRDKDVLIRVADELGLRYQRLSKAGRGMVGNALELAVNVFRCIRFGRRFGIDLWITQYAAGNLAARVTGKKSLCYNDDDIDAVPIACWLAYLPAHRIITPAVTRVGRFEYKRTTYRGTHELFYLHPKRFTPDPGIRGELGLGQKERFALIRLVSLQAHHDRGIRGMSLQLVERILELFEGRVRIFVSAEGKLPEPLDRRRLPVKPSRVHHVLAFAEFFIGDSQSMTAEAGVLGTPAFRISDFVGRLSYLEMLEEYGLAFGFKPGDSDGLLAKLREVTFDENAKTRFQEQRDRLLEEMDDPVEALAKAVRDELPAGS